MNVVRKPRIAIIGMGPAGLFAALLLSQFDLFLDVYEKGTDINRRNCPYKLSGICSRCLHCGISEGLGGGGGGADGKALESEGGNAVKIMGKTKYHKYLKWASAIYASYAELAGISPIKYGRTITEYLEACKKRAKKQGLVMEILPIDHYGTDGARRLYYQIEHDLKSKPNVNLYFETEVDNIDFSTRSVYSEKLGEVQYDDIIISPGRSGSDWFAEVCEKNNIQSRFGKLIVGVRAEVPDYIDGERKGPLVEVERDCLEGKLRKKFPDGFFVKSAKTFCQCEGGEVTTEYYPGKGVAVNGHSNSETKTRFSNVSLLLDIDSEQVENPKEFIWDLLKLANKEGKGQPITQTYSAFKERRANTTEELKNLKSTKKKLFAGDLTKVFSPAMVSALTAFIEAIDKVFPGFIKNLVLHGIEIKPVSFTPEIDDCFRVAPHIYVAGDGVNLTHGLLPASGIGLAVAAKLLKHLAEIYLSISISYKVLKKDHTFLP